LMQFPNSSLARMHFIQSQRKFAILYIETQRAVSATHRSLDLSLWGLLPNASRRTNPGKFIDRRTRSVINFVK
jgi:hypothetical protein